MSYENPWIYENKIFNSEDINTFCGFVYCITDNANDKKYIGKKLFTSAKTRQINKKKKRFRIESDWKTYYGSSDEVKKLVEELGILNFSRQILHLCYNKSEMSYLEASEQIERKVLLSDSYYNEFIGLKLHAKGLKRLKEYYNNGE